MYLFCIPSSSIYTNISHWRFLLLTFTKSITFLIFFLANRWWWSDWTCIIIEMLFVVIWIVESYVLDKHFKRIHSKFYMTSPKQVVCWLLSYKYFYTYILQWNLIPPQLSKILIDIAGILYQLSQKLIHFQLTLFTVVTCKVDFFLYRLCYLRIKWYFIKRWELYRLHFEIYFVSSIYVDCIYTYNLCNFKIILRK